MLLADVVATSAAVAGTSSRLAKIEEIATCLRAASPGEVGLVVRYLSGELRQRRLGAGWAALRDMPPPATVASLSVTEVDGALGRVEQASGAGATGQRSSELAALFGRATAGEQHFLRRLIGGELRQGALAGIAAEAVSKAADVPISAVRRAAMLAGDLAVIAEAAMLGGTASLARFTLEVGRPLQPMLAQSAPSLTAALRRVERAAIEWKLDGVRVQIHRQGRDVAVYTRTLDDITDRVPELVEAALALPVSSVVLDGETIALGPDGRPRLFQETASRVASRGDAARWRERFPLTTYLFDALHLDGADLIDLPGEERYKTVGAVLPGDLWVPRVETPDSDEAEQFLAGALDRGHEGVVVKSLTSPYESGRRGAGWIKVKPRHTLDLVVLAVEWGHGRRQGWLSNLHLGARDPRTGGFVMLGKTFKGLTDEMLRWQTERFLTLEASRDRWTVYVRPEQVVEIAFDGVQTSSRYPGGVALRFARVIGYRDDKRADQADTIDAVRALHASLPPEPASPTDEG